MIEKHYLLILTDFKNVFIKTLSKQEYLDHLNTF